LTNLIKYRKVPFLFPTLKNGLRGYLENEDPNTWSRYKLTLFGAGADEINFYINGQDVFYRKTLDRAHPGLLGEDPVRTLRYAQWSPGLGKFIEINTYIMI